MNYCLLCDKYLSFPTYRQHNYHRYNHRYFIEYFKDEEFNYRNINAQNLIISILSEDLPKDSEILFKGLHMWEMAESVYNKLKVFK